MTAFAERVAPAGWLHVDFIADLHLQAVEPATVDAWRGYLESTPADALFILGDLFEVWIGDDSAAQPGFEADCAQLLRSAARRMPVFLMHGNRDFLVGDAFARQAGLTLVDDPTVLALHDRRWLLSHGDLLCLDDADYLAFREHVRTPGWQSAFLSRPLERRREAARGMRAESENRKREPGRPWADVDAAAARDWLQRANATTLVHGHTHRPADHDLGDGLTRIVLSDWDATATPARLEVLRIGPAGARRVDLP